MAAHLEKYQLFLKKRNNNDMGGSQQAYFLSIVLSKQHTYMYICTNYQPERKAQMSVLSITEITYSNGTVHSYVGKIIF